MTARTSKKPESVKTLAEVQEYVESLNGQPVVIVYNNRGREVKEEGTITNVYKNIFIFSFVRNGQSFKSSFTYSDLLTNVITLLPASQD